MFFDDPFAFTYFDYVVLLIFILSGLFSMLRGMTREFLGLTGWIVAIGVALSTATWTSDWLSEYLIIGGIIGILSWALPFTLTVVLWFILATLISPGLKQAGLGALDKWLGIIFGLLRGLLFVMIIYGGLVGYVGAESNLPENIRASKSAPLISGMISSVQSLDILPTNIHQVLAQIKLDADRSNLNDNLNENIDAGAKTLSDGYNLLSDEQ